MNGFIQTFPGGKGGGGGSDIQRSSLPIPSATEAGKIYQYIGVTTAIYQNGCFYKCVEDTTPGTYKWVGIGVEDPSTYENDPIDFNNDW